MKCSQVEFATTELKQRLHISEAALRTYVDQHANTAAASASASHSQVSWLMILLNQKDADSIDRIALIIAEQFQMGGS